MGFSMGTTRQEKEAGRELAGLLRPLRTALDEATFALVEGEPVVSTTLLATEKALRAVRRGIEVHVAAVESDTWARMRVGDRPFGSAVRAIVAQVQVNASVEVAADLVRQIADIAHSRLGRPAIPERLLELLREMDQSCAVMLDGAADALETGTAPHMVRFIATFNEVGRLQLAMLEDCGDAELEAALDATLAGRCYERIAEHLVSVARQARLLAAAAESS
jgi:phosphate transport system protein